MKELFDATFSSLNVIPTFFLLMVILYWIAVILGAMDLGFLDFDLDPDFETDVEVEVDVSGEVGWFSEFLSFFNLGRVPFMVFFTALVIPMWLMSVNINHYLGIENVMLATLLQIPYFFVSLFVSKIITSPLSGVFERLNDDAMSKEALIGKTGRVVIECSSTHKGQIEVKIDGDSFILTAKTRKGIVLPKSSTALIVEYNHENDNFIVAPFGED